MNLLGEQILQQDQPDQDLVNKVLGLKLGNYEEKLMKTVSE